MLKRKLTYYLVESGAIEAIIEVLKAHPGALDVVRTSIEALRKLATDTRNAELLAKAGMFYFLL